MRKIRLESITDPREVIQLSDLTKDYFCTSLQTFGMKRELEFFAIKNRRQAVSNNPSFKRIVLRIEILSSYNLYEEKYRNLARFLDKHKRNGIRLYYQADTNEPEMYTICDIEEVSKTDKRMPVTLTLQQNSLWLISKEEKVSKQEQSGNVFAFSNDGYGFYSAGFKQDSDYSISFYSTSSKAEITNNSYEKVPLIIRITSECTNPTIFIRDVNGKNYKTIKINASVASNEYLEINSNVFESQIYLYNEATGFKTDLSGKVDYSYGSPFAMIGNGIYTVEVTDENQTNCEATIWWQEEYNI